MLTDSSLCSDQVTLSPSPQCIQYNDDFPQERDAQWTDSSESLNKQQSPVSPDQVPCLESVNLNSNLAIRLLVTGHKKPLVTDYLRVSGVMTTAASTAGAAGGRPVTTVDSRVSTPSGGVRGFTTRSEGAARAR